MNMKPHFLERKTSKILSVLGSPFRVRLILALGDGEACVCHLETLLKKRQAYISQHLMALRNAGLLDTRRDGKFIYYRLSSPEIIILIQDAARIAGIEGSEISLHQQAAKLEKCVCPKCGNEQTKP